MVLVLQTGDSLVHCRIRSWCDIDMRNKKKYNKTGRTGGQKASELD